MVDIRFVRKFKVPLSLDMLRGESRLKGMELLRKGSRLSVQPVRDKEWVEIIRLVEAQAKREGAKKAVAR